MIEFSGVDDGRVLPTLQYWLHTERGNWILYRAFFSCSKIKLSHFSQFFSDFDVMRRFGIPEVGAIRFFGGKLRYLGQCRNASKKFRVALFRNKGGNALLYVLDNS